MANCAKSYSSLSDVLDDAGINFASDSERNEYIVRYYAKLYEKPLAEPDSLEGCIEGFLGPDIMYLTSDCRQ